LQLGKLRQKTSFYPSRAAVSERAWMGTQVCGPRPARSSLVACAGRQIHADAENLAEAIFRGKELFVFVCWVLSLDRISLLNLQMPLTGKAV